MIAPVISHQHKTMSTATPYAPISSTAKRPADANLAAVELRREGGDPLVFQLPGGATTIGGGPRCLLRLQGKGVHPLHCVISHDEQGATVRRWSADTLLNGEDFREAPLNVGDRLTIASIDLVVAEASQEPTPAEPEKANLEAPQEPASDQLTEQASQEANSADDSESQGPAPSPVSQVEPESPFADGLDTDSLAEPSFNWSVASTTDELQDSLVDQVAELQDAVAKSEGLEEAQPVDGADEDPFAAPVPLPAVPAHLLTPWLSSPEPQEPKREAPQASSAHEDQPEPPAVAQAPAAVESEADTESTASPADAISMNAAANVQVVRGHASARARKLVEAIRGERRRAEEAESNAEELARQLSAAQTQLEASLANVSEQQARAERIEQLEAEVSRLEAELQAQHTSAEDYRQRVGELELAVEQLEQLAAANASKADFETQDQQNGEASFVDTGVDAGVAANADSPGDQQREETIDELPPVVWNVDPEPVDSEPVDSVAVREEPVDGEDDLEPAQEPEPELPELPETDVYNPDFYALANTTDQASNEPTVSSEPAADSSLWNTPDAEQPTAAEAAPSLPAEASSPVASDLWADLNEPAEPSTAVPNPSSEPTPVAPSALWDIETTTPSAADEPVAASPFVESDVPAEVADVTEEASSATDAWLNSFSKTEASEAVDPNAEQGDRGPQDSNEEPLLPSVAEATGEMPLEEAVEESIDDKSEADTSDNTTDEDDFGSVFDEIESLASQSQHLQRRRPGALSSEAPSSEAINSEALPSEALPSEELAPTTPDGGDLAGTSDLVASSAAESDPQSALPETSDDLIPDNQPSSDAPESFLARFADSLPADEMAVEPSPPVAVPVPTSPATEAADPAGEDSIDDYMAGLMQRIRGESEGEAEKASLPKPTVQPVASPAPTPTPVADPGVMVDPPKPDRLANLDELRSGPGAEHNRDMSALRELANSSARSAVGVAENRLNKEKAFANVAISGIAMACSAYLAFSSSSILGSQFLVGVAGFGWAAYWGSQTLRHMIAAERARALADGRVDRHAPSFDGSNTANPSPAE